MLGWLILVISLAVGSWLLVRSFVNSNPAALARTLRWLGAGALTMLLLYLTIIGHGLWLLAVLPLLFGVRRYYPLRRPIRTSLVEIFFDPQGQPSDGMILAGTWQGRTLSSLPQEVLLELVSQWQSTDPQSAQILKIWLAYLSQRSSRRSSRHSYQRPFQHPGAMDKATAYRILGLEPGASPADIRAAHRLLIGKLHPDRGGSDHLAAQINQARDLLLRK